MYLSPGTHGVVIIHGIGDQRPGDTIAEFTKSLCDALINSPRGNSIPTIQLKSDVSGNPPSVTMQITTPYDEKATWFCQEAFWNDAFPPPKATQVLWWGVNQNLGKQISSLFKILQDPVNEDLPTQIEQQKELKKVKNGVKATGPVKLSNKSKAGVMVKSLALSGIAMVPLVPLTYVVLGMIWLFHFIPSIGPLDKIFSWIRKLDPFISSSLGDIERYIDHEIWSANARARLEKIVINMLNDNEIKDITIVAHSMGAVVAYDALTEGGNIAQVVAGLDESKHKKITFISVGGAINRVFDMISPPDSRHPGHKKLRDIKYNDLQITKPLAKAITGFGDAKYVEHLEDRFFWLDIFARRDPVPAGPVAADIVEKAKIDPIKQMKERKVINKDSLVFDHVAYWENTELVIPRIVRAINGGVDYPWPEAGITEMKVSRRVQKALKLAGLTKIALLLILLGAVVFVCLQLTGVI